MCRLFDHLLALFIFNFLHNRSKNGASVLKLAEENQAQRHALDCATTPNHKMVGKIALA